MAINRFMLLALKALSYPDYDLQKNYPIDRALRTVKGPLLKPLYRLWDQPVEVDGRRILTRIYLPPKGEERNTLLFFHGGGWVTESVDTYNSVCRSLARHTGSQVISVEYRLAPEHPFPQGLEDCYAVARALFLHPQRRLLFPGQITLIGDSAGANLAAAVSLMARDRGEFAIERQILLYPATYCDYSDRSPFPSVRDNGRDYLLTQKRLRDYIALYQRSDEDLQNPYFAPLLAPDKTHQPRTLLITAQYDPLRDEGEEYARQLSQAGNDVTCVRINDALHGFLSLGVRYVHVKKTYALIREFLKEE